MHVTALGLSPLKGGAQHRPAALELTAHGVRSDRRFCCVDPQARRVLRTVENPALLALRVEVGPGAGHDEETLTVHVPGTGPVSGPVPGPRPADRWLRADYWGRQPRLRLLEGPWPQALSAHLGRDVVLAEAAPRDVVYAGGVTLVTTSSLREVARRDGRAPTGAQLVADAERWRANVVLDTGDAPAFCEDAWQGRDLRLGGTVLRLRGGVPRCAVVRLRPGSGERDATDPLALLAGDRRRGREVVFGLDAEVVVPGRLAVGDTCGPVDAPGRLQP